MDNVDSTEAARRALVAEMPREVRRVIEAGEPVWNTDELRRDFDVIGFAAPFVVARRKSDGVEGSLQFCASPRLYFGWKEG